MLIFLSIICQSISLTDLSDGTVDSINTANDSGDRPDESAPHGMEEFYNYDHDKSGAQVPTNLAAYTTNETIAYVSFDTQAGTTRVYMYLNYDGITGSGTGYAGTQIVLGSSGAAVPPWSSPSTPTSSPCHSSSRTSPSADP